MRGVLAAPEQHHTVRPGHDVLQSKIVCGGKIYLLRVFVDLDIKALKETLLSLIVEASRGSVKGELTIRNESALIEALKRVMMSEEAPRRPPAPPAKPR